MCVYPIKLQSYGITNTGHVRSNNEDVFAHVEQKQFYLLADGMGGHKAGEVASSYAMQSMCESFKNLEHPSSIEETCLFLRQAIATTNTKVFNESLRSPEYSGMGTTLSCFAVVENTLIYGHIGDSRLYRYRDKLEQLTQDHSLHPTTLAKKGLSANQKRNVITRAIGYQPTILPDIGVIPIQQKDIYMLCSDGLSDYVPEVTIAKVLSSSFPLEQAGDILIQAALERGGYDNVTLLLVKVI